MADYIALAACILIAAAGGIWDIRVRRIPNLVSLALAAAALGYLMLQSDFDAGAAKSAGLHAVIALLVGMALFRLGVIGGGDAKLYAAGALGVPLGKALFMLGWTSVAGLVLLIVMMIMRRLGMPVGPRDDKGHVLVPYGVAIAAGFAVTLLE